VLNGVKGDYLNTYLTLAAAPATQVIPALLPQDSIYPQPVVPLVQPQLQSQLQRPTGGKR
jgi:phospholipid/cholesterol/gamma-HCH transport system substrate-binding protein